MTLDRQENMNNENRSFADKFEFSDKSFGKARNYRGKNRLKLSANKMFKKCIDFATDHLTASYCVLLRNAGCDSKRFLSRVEQEMLNATRAQSELFKSGL